MRRYAPTGRAGHHGNDNNDVEERRDGDSGRRLGSVENLVAEDGHRVHNLAGFNEGPAQLGLHLRVCATSTLHGNRYTRRTHQSLHVAAGASCMARAADGRISGSRFPVPGPRTSGPQDSRLPAPGPSVSRETIGGPRATPPPGASRTRQPPPFGHLTCALHIRAIVSPIGISVQIVAHNFTCRLRGCREHGSMFDKVRREMLATTAHLCRSSPQIG